MSQENDRSDKQVAFPLSLVYKGRLMFSLVPKVMQILEMGVIRLCGGVGIDLFGLVRKDAQPTEYSYMQTDAKILFQLHIAVHKNP